METSSRALKGEEKTPGVGSCCMEGAREGGGRDIVVEWDRYEGGSGDASRHAGKRERPQNNKTSGYNSSQMSLAQRKGDGVKCVGHCLRKVMRLKEEGNQIKPVGIKR